MLFPFFKNSIEILMAILKTELYKMQNDGQLIT